MVGLEHVAKEAQHRDAPVLHLCVPQERDGGGVRLAPELFVCEVKGVEELDPGVTFRGEFLQRAPSFPVLDGLRVLIG